MRLHNLQCVDQLLVRQELMDAHARTTLLWEGIASFTIAGEHLLGAEVVVTTQPATQVTIRGESWLAAISLIG